MLNFLSMSGLKVCLTGASSFTGAHIARAFIDRGHQVLATFTRPSSQYQGGIVADRLDLVPETLKVFDAPFGSENFCSALRDFKPQILVNHGADITGYRDPSFDPDKAYQSATSGLGRALREFQAGGGKHLIHSGTVFEPVDGLPAQSPYGFAKTRVAETFETAAAEAGLSFTKVFIANPVGPFENEDRLIPLFVRKWKAGERPTLSAPKILWDNVPATWLAHRYVDAAEAASAPRVLRPSAYRISLKSFVDLFIEHARLRGVRADFSYEIPAQVPDAPLNPRLNTEVCSELADPKAVEEFFDFWIASHWPEARKRIAP